MAFVVAIAGTGGAIAQRLGAPLPYLFGALVVIMVATIMGLRPAPVPAFGNTLTRATIGTLVGSAVDPSLLTRLPELGLSALFIPVQIALIVIAGSIFLRWVSDMGPTERVLSALPGGFVSIVLTYQKMGGDIWRIAILHSIRVAVVVAVIPVVVVWGMGFEGDISSMSPPLVDMLPQNLLVFFLVLGAGVFLASVIKVSGGQILFPIFIAAGLRLTGIGAFPPPLELTIAVQIFFGMQLGATFGLDASARFRLWAVIAVGLTIITMAISMLLAYGLHVVGGISFAAALLAFAPGGIAEVGIIAVSLGIDPGFVASLHLLRLLLILFSVPFAVRLMPPGEKFLDDMKSQNKNKDKAS